MEKYELLHNALQLIFCSILVPQLTLSCEKTYRSDNLTDLQLTAGFAVC
jgi:hypothetical protein